MNPAQSSLAQGQNGRRRAGIIMCSVVVMDEDGPIRALLAEWLAAAGYRVREWSPLETEPNREVELVLIDLPKLRQSGAETIARARHAYPLALLLGLSTQLAESLPAGSALVRELGLSGLLAKPCERLEMLAAVAEARARAV
jgi:CheY-like chemotaxis protein